MRVETFKCKAAEIRSWLQYTDKYNYISFLKPRDGKKQTPRLDKKQIQPIQKFYNVYCALKSPLLAKR